MEVLPYYDATHDLFFFGAPKTALRVESTWLYEKIWKESNN